MIPDEIKKYVNVNEEKNEITIWKVVNAFFNENGAVRQQINSFNNFVQNSLQNIVDDMPPIIIFDEIQSKHEISNLSEKRGHVKSIFRLGQLNLSKPSFIEEDGSVRTLYPNEARMRGLSYSASLNCDASFTRVLSYNENNNKKDRTLEQSNQKILLGRLPIMVKSKYCVLDKLGTLEIVPANECLLDPGGYFIINGSEKVIVSQEQLAWNRVYVFKKALSKEKKNEIENYTKMGALFFC